MCASKGALCGESAEIRCWKLPAYGDHKIISNYVSSHFMSILRWVTMLFVQAKDRALCGESADISCWKLPARQTNPLGFIQRWPMFIIQLQNVLHLGVIGGAIGTDIKGWFRTGLWAICIRSSLDLPVITFLCLRAMYVISFCPACLGWPSVGQSWESTSSSSSSSSSKWARGRGRAEASKNRRPSSSVGNKSTSATSDLSDASKCCCCSAHTPPPPPPPRSAVTAWGADELDRGGASATHTAD